MQENKWKTMATDLRSFIRTCSHCCSLESAWAAFYFVTEMARKRNDKAKPRAAQRDEPSETPDQVFFRDDSFSKLSTIRQQSLPRQSRLV